MRKPFFRSLIIGLFALSAAGCTGGGSINAPRLGSTIAPFTHLYVADSNTAGKIYIYTLPLSAASVPTGTLTGVNVPNGMRFDSSGRLFVGSYNVSNVAVFASPVTSGNTPAFTIATANDPYYVNVDASGNLFASESNSGTCCIEVFAPPITAASTPAFTITNGADNPYGIAFDSAGRLYDSGGSTIPMYTPTFSAASVPTATVAGNNDNYGIAVGPTQQLYVENATVNGTIDVFATPLTNTSVRSFGIVVGPELYDIVTDSAGNLYVTAVDGNVYFIPAPITAASVPTFHITPPTNAEGVTVGP
jgi:hypothetical protein